MAERKKIQKVRLGGVSHTTRSAPDRNQRVSKNTSKPHSENKQKQKAEPKSNRSGKTNNGGYRSASIKKSKPSKTLKRSKTSPDIIEMKRTTTEAKRRAPEGEKRKTTGPNLNIILGRKKENRQKRLLTYAIVFPIVLALICFVLLTPTGPIEAVTNTLATIGGGEYPKAVVGSKVCSLKTEDNRAFLLTNTHISAYTAGGKCMFEYQHDFNSPVLKTSSTRSLVYNREGTEFIVFNNSNSIYEKELENTIYCGDISESGNVVFATESERYSAQIEVFSKGMKSKFTWYAVDGLISDVAISNNGKKIAVAVLKVENGAFSSEIKCFDIKSEEPMYTIKVPGDPVLSVQNVSTGYFAYTTEEGVSFVKWKNGLETRAEEPGLSPSFFKIQGGNTVVVFGKNTSVTVNVYSSNGTKKHSFSFNSLVDDVTVCYNKVYILKSNKIYIMDLDGNLLEYKSCEQTLSGISAAKNGVFAMDNENLMYFK